MGFRVNREVPPHLRGFLESGIFRVFWEVQYEVVQPYLGQYPRIRLESLSLSATAQVPLGLALPSMLYRLWTTRGNTEKLAQVLSP